MKDSVYTVEIKGVKLDYYDLVDGLNIEGEAVRHACKKLIYAGKRIGGKTRLQDLEEALWSIQRAIVQEKEKNPLNQISEIPVDMNWWGHSTAAIKGVNIPKENWGHEEFIKEVTRMQKEAKEAQDKIKLKQPIFKGGDLVFHKDSPKIVMTVDSIQLSQDSQYYYGCWLAGRNNKDPERFTRVCDEKDLALVYRVGEIR